MIAGSRRKCKVYVGETGNCDNCNDLGYVPDLSMQAVEEFMLHYGSVVSEAIYYDGYRVRVEWHYLGMQGDSETVVKADDHLDNHYPVMLQVCLAGLEAMEVTA